MKRERGFETSRFKKGRGMLVRAKGFLAGLIAAALVVALPWEASAAPGDLDGSFGSGGRVTTGFGADSQDKILALALQPDGKLVGVAVTFGSSSASFALARYNADGSLDGSFGTGGKVTTKFTAGSDDEAFAVALQPDGKIVVAGSSNAGGSTDFALARYNVDGSLDASFGSGGKVTTNFGATSFDLAAAVALQPDGKIVLGGFSDASGSFDFALARYNTNGSLDATFGTAGKVTTNFGAGSDDEISALVLQPDGKIVAAGFSDASGNLDFALARYNANGSLDASFGSGGKVTTSFGAGSDEEAGALALQADGKIVAAGFSSASGSSDFALARYNTDGSLDAGFGSAGKVITNFGGSSEGITALVLQADGKIVAAGVSRTPAAALISPWRATTTTGASGAAATTRLRRSSSSRTASSWPRDSRTRSGASTSLWRGTREDPESAGSSSA